MCMLSAAYTAVAGLADLSCRASLQLVSHHRFPFISCSPKTTCHLFLAVWRRHVIIETNKTTARIFPQVPDCEAPVFWDRMEALIRCNKKLAAISASDAPAWLKNLQRLPVFERFAKNLLQLFLGPVEDIGSVDFVPENDAALAY